jgi:hypothetical protein
VVATAATGIPAAFAADKVAAPAITKVNTPLVAANEAGVTITLTGKDLTGVTMADINSSNGADPAAAGDDGATNILPYQCHNAPAVWDATKKILTITVPGSSAAVSTAVTAVPGVTAVVDDPATPADETVAAVTAVAGVNKAPALTAGCPATTGTTAETITLYKPGATIGHARVAVGSPKTAAVTFVNRAQPVAYVAHVTEDAAATPAVVGAGADSAYLVNGANLDVWNRKQELSIDGGQLLRVDAKLWAALDADLGSHVVGTPVTPFVNTKTAKFAVAVKDTKNIPLTVVSVDPDGKFAIVKTPKFKAAIADVKLVVTNGGIATAEAGFATGLSVGAAKPVVTGVSPAFGPFVKVSADGGNIQIKGTGFGTSPVVTICGETATAAPVAGKVKAGTDKLITVLAPKSNTGPNATVAHVCPVVVTSGSASSSLNGTSSYAYLSE